jgi:hypothetical protein
MIKKNVFGSEYVSVTVNIGSSKAEIQFVWTVYSIVFNPNILAEVSGIS